MHLGEKSHIYFYSSPLYVSSKLTINNVIIDFLLLPLLSWMMMDTCIFSKVKNSVLFHLAQPFSKRYTRYNVLIARYIKN
jgi:hypothetical protein